MNNALDMFREQQDAARQVHAQLVEVAALLEQPGAGCRHRE